MNHSPPFKSSWLVFLVLSGLIFTACDSSSSSSSEFDEAVDGPVELIHPWVEAEPADVGIDGRALLQALIQANTIPRMKSLVVVKDGRLVMEEYLHGAERGDLFDVRSVTKTIISILVGMALEDGSIPGLDTPIGTHLDGIQEEVPEEVKAITVRNLLMMSAGWQWDEWSSTSYSDWMASTEREQYVLNRPLINDPGTTFTYNSGAVHILGVLTQQLIGESIIDYADRKLFQQLGIIDREWEMLNATYPNGGAGIDLKATDLAKIGQLFLQGGVSGERRLISSEWVGQATTPKWTWRSGFGPLHSTSYGYLWWTDDTDNVNSFFAWGFGGQFIFVVPSKELVVVATSDFAGVTRDPGGEQAVARAVMAVIQNYVVPSVM